jgi:signal transduction histidine kinase
MNKLERAGKILHDDVGPLLSAAGLRLQLIKMDHPETAALVRDVTEVLDNAIDRVRAVSQELLGK